MRCSICHNETNAVFTPDEKTFYCNDCLQKKVARERAKRLYRCELVKRDEHGNIVGHCPWGGGIALLSDKQIATWQGRVAKEGWECVQCQHRPSPEDDWQDTSFPTIPIKPLEDR